MNAKPIGDRVLVKPVVTEEIAGGIIIPDSAKEKSQECEVVALGTCKLIDGQRADFCVEVGCHVLMPKYGGTEVKIGDEQYFVISESELLAIVW